MLPRASVRLPVLWLVFGHGFQILLRVIVEDQIGVFQRHIVDQPVQLRSLLHIVGSLVFHGNAVDGNHGAVRIQ